MITFIVSVVLLLLGYWLYSKLIERIIGVDPQRTTPAVAHPDGVDYVPMKPWRIFLIQFLNIAGVGPIIGAVMGAQFGTASFLWIVFGCILAGAVHDFIAGFISIRQDGASLPEIHGKYLGNGMKQFMRYFTVFLMILVGVVFVKTPASLLTGDPFVPSFLAGVDSNVILYGWIIIIFAYYLLATLLPIDKVIGKIYPVFGILLLAMAVAIVVAFVVHGVDIPEVWEKLSNQHPQAETSPIFPMMFISIACGAISGFHATQSPLMARCMVNEKQARPIFYGAMIAEGVVALIWAAAAAYFFYGGDASLYHGEKDAGMVKLIANTWFPTAIAFITLLGVVSAAVTSGDTALRSARLIVADFMHIDQKPVPKRLLVAVPIFAITAGLLIFAVANNDGFQVIWRYFSWANQVLAMVTLWAVTVFLAKLHPTKAWYWITLIPALFMSMVTISFIFVAQKEGLGGILPRPVGYAIAAALTIGLGVLFFLRRNNTLKKNSQNSLNSPTIK
ncbi:MAG: carbon starvation protein A [Bacteroidales bacterium]|nr:carbon starvation protein A [Bacteroidales bacterium]